MQEERDKQEQTEKDLQEAKEKLANLSFGNFHLPQSLHSLTAGTPLESLSTSSFTTSEMGANSRTQRTTITHTSRMHVTSNKEVYQLSGTTTPSGRPDSLISLPISDASGAEAETEPEEYDADTDGSHKRETCKEKNFFCLFLSFFAAELFLTHQMFFSRISGAFASEFLENLETFPQCYID